MGVINRYSRTPAPLQYSVRSVDDYAKVGLAKASSDIAAYKAVNMINTDYDVMNKQQEYVDDQLKPLKDNINELTTAIINNDAGNRASQLHDLVKQRNSLLGQDSDIFAMQMAKIQQDDYNRKMQANRNNMTPGMAEALMQKAQSNYMDNWNSGNRKAEYEGNLGVNDSKFQDKMRAIAKDMNINSKKTATAWNSIYAKDPSKQIFSKTKNGLTALYYKNGTKLTDTQTKEAIAAATLEYAKQDKSIMSDLSLRQDLGLIDSTDQLLQDTANNLGDVYKKDNILSKTLGIGLLGTVKAGYSSSNYSVLTK